MQPYTGDYIEHIDSTTNNFKYYTFAPRPLMNGNMYQMDDELATLLTEAHRNIGFLEGLIQFAPNRDPFTEAIMRSPLRFDFDPSNTSELHPATHVHMQHADCRISAKRPICFNTFIKFVFKNFYPNCCPSILDDLKRLNYSGFDIFDKAVICL